jgi:hypothetical protein
MPVIEPGRKQTKTCQFWAHATDDRAWKGPRAANDNSRRPWPFAEGEIGRDDDRRALLEATDQMEQQLAAGLREGQIAEFVENDEVEARQIIGKPPLTASAGLRLETIHQIDGGVKAPAQSGRAPEEATLDEMEALWVEAKGLEGK